MKLTLDGVVAEIQSTGVNWQTPKQFGYDGVGQPVYGPFWSCSLSFERLTVPQFHQWWDAAHDGESHQVMLPHPAKDGIHEVYSCRVHNFAPRMDTRDICQAAANGVDILLTRIEVE